VVAAVVIWVLPEVVVLEVAETGLSLARPAVAERLIPEAAAAVDDLGAPLAVPVVPVL
jgi:hypothetical protein